MSILLERFLLYETEYITLKNSIACHQSPYPQENTNTKYNDSYCDCRTLGDFFPIALFLAIFWRALARMLGWR